MFEEPYYEMYTDDGNKAVDEALNDILHLSKDRTKVWNKATLEAAARPVIRAVADNYPEVYDTEPRNYIYDFLDRLCKAHGWAYSEYDGYNLS